MCQSFASWSPADLPRQPPDPHDAPPCPFPPPSHRSLYQSFMTDLIINTQELKEDTSSDPLGATSTTGTSSKW